jgi:hypothetical protein
MGFCGFSLISRKEILLDIWDIIGWQGLGRPVRPGLLSPQIKHEAIVEVHEKYPTWPDHLLWEVIRRDYIAKVLAVAVPAKLSRWAFHFLFFRVMAWRFQRVEMMCLG